MKTTSFLALFSLFLFSACGSSSSRLSANSNLAENSSGIVEFAASKTVDMPEAGNASNSAMRIGGGGGGGREEPPLTPQNISLAQTSASAIDTAPTDRKIIRNAELNLEAADPEEAQRTITGIAELKGGFVVESQQSSSDIKVTTRDTVTMTVRVPADRFSETLTEIRGTASRVVVETVKGQDVTEEFIDIEAQLKAKKALEQQFMEIMKRANTVDDALSVQSQLASVRGEIERVEGRKRFLENQSSLSTIKVRLQTAKVFAATSKGFGGQLTDSFAAGADVAIGFVLGLVTIIVAGLPFAIFVGLPAFIIIRYFWKKQSRPRSVVELAQEELKGSVG